VLARKCYAVAGWEQVDEEEAIQVSAFYGANNHRIENLFSAAFTFIFAVAFAVFHLLVWFARNVFPSRIESILWVSFSWVLFFVPVCALLCALLHRAGVTSKYVTFPLLVGLYIFVRIFLLVLAFVALRDLPPKALDKIQWPPFILFFMGN
jgi:hypothetical protein